MKFQIELQQDEFNRLCELAAEERRNWRAQAAHLVSEALKQNQGKTDCSEESQHDGG